MYYNLTGVADRPRRARAARHGIVAEPRSDASLALRGGPAATLGLRLFPHVWLLLDAAVLPVLSGWVFVVHRVDDPSVTTPVVSQATAVEVGAALLWRFGGA